MKFDPLISIKLNHANREYQPGDLLECEYQVDAVNREELKSVEVATMWYTSGKGDEEEAIHYYERQILCFIIRFQHPCLQHNNILKLFLSSDLSKV